MGPQLIPNDLRLPGTSKNRCGVSALRWCGVKYGRAPNGHFTHMKDSKQVRLFQESVVFEVSAAIGVGSWQLMRLPRVQLCESAGASL